MDSKDLPYLVARVAALEALVVALLAQAGKGEGDDDIRRVSTLAQRYLERPATKDGFWGDNIEFNAMANEFIADVALKAEQLPPLKT